MNIRAVWHALILFLPLSVFAQFDNRNEIGVGVNVPALVAIREYIPFPIAQIDYKHEFYFKTRNPNIDKSTELRIGFGGMSLPSSYLYMLNLGWQNSFVETKYLQAIGIDVLAYTQQTQRTTAKIFDTATLGKGQGAGIGFFYKTGRSLGRHFSLTLELGVMGSIDNYTVFFNGPAFYNSGYTPNVGIYRANLSLNYHF